MKGTITITADEKMLNCQGAMAFESEKEPYIVVRSVAKALGLTTPEQLAKLVLVLAVLMVDGKEKVNSTEIRIPRNKGEANGRND